MELTYKKQSCTELTENDIRMNKDVQLKKAQLIMAQMLGE